MNNIELLIHELQQVEDWRNARGIRYRLDNLLAIIVLSIIAGADDFMAIEAFCQSKKDFLVKNGLLDGKRFPSHDLIRNIFQALDKKAFASLLSEWLQKIADQDSESVHKKKPAFDQKMIHVDGKSLRASRRSNEHSRSALQIVSAYCSNDSVCIGQRIIDQKSCEKTAIPKLLEMIDLRNSIVTIDAIASAPKNAALIIGNKADYVLALKKNNKKLYNEVESFFQHFTATPLIVDMFEEQAQVHGRVEKRTCEIISDLIYFPGLKKWKGIKCLVCITAKRTVGEQTSQEKRYYLTSLPPDARTLAHAIRKHWSVENNLHWILDVAFNEDRCRIRDKQAAANFAALRRFALGLLKNAKLSKLGIKNQRLQAAWDDQFLERIFYFFSTVNQLITS